MIEHLSPSGYSTWRQCGRKFWYHYFEKLPGDPPNEATLTGTVVHEALEAIFGGTEPVNLADAARSAWGAHLAEIEALGVDELAMKRAVWDALTRIYAEWFGARVHAVEMEVTFTVETRGGNLATFLGKVDLVEEVGPGLYVHDAKTGKIPRDDYYGRQKIVAMMDQPALYAVGVGKATERPVVGYALDFANGGEFQSFSGTATSGALSRWMLAWDEITDLDQAGAVPEEAPGPLCGWCPYVDRCEPGEKEVRERWRLNKSVGPAKERLGLS